MAKHRIKYTSGTTQNSLVKEIDADFFKTSDQFVDFIESDGMGGRTVLRVRADFVVQIERLQD